MAIQNNDKFRVTKLEQFIRGCFEKNGFEFTETKIFCIYGYLLQLTAWAFFGLLSIYFISKDTMALPAFYLNLVSFLINVISHITLYYEINEKLKDPLGEPISCTNEGRVFYRKVATVECLLMFLLLSFTVVAYKFWLPTGVSFDKSNVIKTFSIFFSLICFIANIETLLERMLSAKIKFERKED